MNPLKDCARLNPFGRSSIGENQIWAEGDEIFCDVESINRKCFDDLNSDLDEIAHNHETRLRFVIGAPGTGKSHVFARLRRNLAGGHFTFAPLLPTEPCEMKRYVLKKVVFGLKHPVLHPTGTLRCLQIVRLVYSLLTRIPRFRGLSVEQMHKNWRQIPRDRYDSVCEEFQSAIADIPGIDIPFHVQRILFRVLDDEKRMLALEWLSGTKTLSDKDHSRLEVTGPLDDTEIMDLLKVLGKLSKDSGPIVMVLDQLDALTKPEQIKEIETLLVDLKDNSANWHIVVSLLEEKFQLWCDNLSEPCLRRFRTVEDGKSVFRVSNLSMISRQQQIELLRQRLADPNLQACREKHNIADSLFPFADETLAQLSCEDFTRPGPLLQLAEQEFQKITTEKPPQPKRLEELLENEFLSILGRLTEDDIRVDTAFRADRITELMQLIERDGKEWQVSEGPLKLEFKKFEGIDRVYSKEGKQIRIVNYDVQQGQKFPSVLEKLKNAPSNTLLVRDGRVPCSGKKTQSLLNEFRLTKSFVHVKLNDVKALHALGHILAKVRQGDYENDVADPKPTPDNIVSSLSRMELIDQIEIGQTIREVLEGKEKPAAVPLRPPGPGGLSRQIERIMRAEGWLSYERLFFRVYTQGVQDLSKETFSETLCAEPLCSLIDSYPKDDVFPEHSRILIWNQE